MLLRLHGSVVVPSSLSEAFGELEKLAGEIAGGQCAAGLSLSVLRRVGFHAFGPSAPAMLLMR